MVLLHGHDFTVLWWFQSVNGVVESMKIVTQENSERVAKYAFEYARKNGRKKVTIIHKANIMLVTFYRFSFKILFKAKYFIHSSLHFFTVINQLRYLSTMQIIFLLIVQSNKIHRIFIKYVHILQWFQFDSFRYHNSFFCLTYSSPLVRDRMVYAQSHI